MSPFDNLTFTEAHEDETVSVTKSGSCCAGGGGWQNSIEIKRCNRETNSRFFNKYDFIFRNALESKIERLFRQEIV